MSMEESRDAFQAAQTYFRARGNNEISRDVGARRGIQLLAAGDWQRAREDLAGIVSSGRDRCSNTVTLMAGTNDQFAGPPDPIPFLSSAFPKPTSPKASCDFRFPCRQCAFVRPLFRYGSGQKAPI